MTDEKIQTLKDDIAFMKALAQEGGSAPLLGGSILVAAGLIFGAASVVHWAVVTGVLAVSPWAFPIIWFAALGLFLVALVILNRRSRDRPGRTRRATGPRAWPGRRWAGPSSSSASR